MCKSRPIPHCHRRRLLIYTANKWSTKSCSSARNPKSRAICPGKITIRGSYFIFRISWPTRYYFRRYQEMAREDVEVRRPAEMSTNRLGAKSHLSRVSLARARIAKIPIRVRGYSSQREMELVSTDCRVARVTARERHSINTNPLGRGSPRLLVHREVHPVGRDERVFVGPARHVRTRGNKGNQSASPERVPIFAVVFSPSIDYKRSLSSIHVAQARSLRRRWERQAFASDCDRVQLRGERARGIVEISRPARFAKGEGKTRTGEFNYVAHEVLLPFSFS